MTPRRGGGRCAHPEQPVPAKLDGRASDAEICDTQRSPWRTAYKSGPLQPCLSRQAASIGPYDIVGLIGMGGMGEVYRARDRKLHPEVALKILPETFATDAERLTRFEREARTLAGNCPDPGAATRSSRALAAAQSGR